MKVKEIMTSVVISVTENETIEGAARLLARHRISGLPVVNQAGAPIGMVTEYDLISKAGQVVSDIMSRGVISVSPETNTEEVIHLLTNQRIRRVPVLDGDRRVDKNITLRGIGFHGIPDQVAERTAQRVVMPDDHGGTTLDGE